MMPGCMLYRPACDVCEVIARPEAHVPPVDDDSRTALIEFLAAHEDCLSDDNPHIRLLPESRVDSLAPVHDYPAPPWAHRPTYGPPEPGTLQTVRCPNCRRADRTVWKLLPRTRERFVFCRGCGNAWGPGADRLHAIAQLRNTPARPDTAGVPIEPPPITEV